MKIDLSTIGYIHQVVKTAKSIGVDAVIIEPGAIRGVEQKTSSCVIVEQDNVQPLPFGSIAISRIDTFIERLNLVSSMNGFAVEALTRGDDPSVPVHKDTPNGMFVTQLKMSAKGLKVDFRASNPLTIKSPRAIKDRMKYELQITPEVVTYLEKAKSAFKAPLFSIVMNDNCASLVITDDNNDKLAYEFTDSITKLLVDDDAPIQFERAFPVEVVLPLFKKDSSAIVKLSERTGYIQLKVSGLSVCIVPRV